MMKKARQTHTFNIKIIDRAQTHMYPCIVLLSLPFFILLFFKICLYFYPHLLVTVVRREGSLKLEKRL